MPERHGVPRPHCHRSRQLRPTTVPNARRSRATTTTRKSSKTAPELGSLTETEPRLSQPASQAMERERVVRRPKSTSFRNVLSSSMLATETHQLLQVDRPEASDLRQQPPLPFPLRPDTARSRVHLPPAKHHPFPLLLRLHPLPSINLRTSIRLLRPVPRPARPRAMPYRHVQAAPPDSPWVLSASAPSRRRR